MKKIVKSKKKEFITTVRLSKMQRDSITASSKENGVSRGRVIQEAISYYFKS